jgi:hypothetical protein
MHFKTSKMFLSLASTLLMAALLFVVASPPIVASTPPPCQITSNFNGTPILAGDYIWFNSVLRVQGLDPTKKTTVSFSGSKIESADFDESAPSATITFDPAVTTSTTTFTAGQWVTTVPASLGGNVFLDGLAFLVPAGGLPGGINPVTWKGTFSSATTGLKFQWKWAAAVYTTFSTNYNSLGVKPVDDNHTSAYQNADRAGTPENFRSFVIGGARGGGASNYTGSYSGTGTCGGGVPPAIKSCLPSSSLSALVQGANVSAYVPLGSWTQLTTGVKHVAVAGAAFATVTIPTAAAVNSCSSNSVTGQTVCVSNGTDVYIIPTPAATAVGTTVTDLATNFQGFSGGSCKTCGVAIDSTLGASGTAVLEIGTAALGVGAMEVLDLCTLSTAASTVVPLGMDTSENISLDPIRHLVLSPNEFASVYQIYNYGTTPGLFNHPVVPLGILDAAASDCTTGIALSTEEGSNKLYVADYTQATFTAGAPGTWTPPATAEATQVFPEFSTLAAGTSGIAVAPGTHLAIVAGEFGGADFGVIQLPATSGVAFPPAGSPGCGVGSTNCPIGDWVRFTMPALPSGGVWSNGLDPHTVTAYTLGTTAFGLSTNNARTFLANIDLACMLSAASGRGATHIATTPAACVTFIAE